MNRPVFGVGQLAALAAALASPTHIGDNIPRIELPVVRKAKGPRRRRKLTTPRAKRRIKMRIQRESRRRNRGR